MSARSNQINDYANHERGIIQILRKYICRMPENEREREKGGGRAYNAKGKRPGKRNPWNIGVALKPLGRFKGYDRSSSPLARLGWLLGLSRFLRPCCSIETSSIKHTPSFVIFIVCGPIISGDTRTETDDDVHSRNHCLWFWFFCLLSIIRETEREREWEGGRRKRKEEKFRW